MNNSTNISYSKELAFLQTTTTPIQIEGESKTCDPVKHHVIALATNNNRQYTVHSSVAFKCISKRTALRYSPSRHTVIEHLPASVDGILVSSI